uniref:Uncharacterized protein n=1 Tax=Pseudictyota dubia TaxID=2749911 RepID=A0A7R9VTL6_9STRA
MRVASSSPTIQLASTVATPSKTKLDKMVENYVRKHMFNDDTFDPFESAYREAYYDQTSSPYPAIISETASDILGKKEVAAKADREGSAIDKAWARLNTYADTLETKFGVNKQLSLSTMFIGIFCTPVIALFLGAIAFGDRQKDKSEQMALERYGYGLNDLSAAEQIDDDVEAPDDEEDDEDEDDDEDDDED